MDQASLNYAAVDGYVSYELYRRIRDMKNSLGPTWLEMIRPWCKSKDRASRRRRGNKKQKDMLELVV